MLRLTPPRSDWLPLLIETPHSGRHYPDDFGHAMPRHILRKTEDPHVDRLFGAAPDHGAPLLEALFARSYIDVNRHQYEVDEHLLAHAWSGPKRRTRAAERGRGVLWRQTVGGRQIYDRRVSPRELRHRIIHYHQPYHQALAELIRLTRDRFGFSLHLSGHAMAAVGLATHSDAGHRRPDIVLGDRDGEGADPEITRVLGESLGAQGLSVAYNKPYRGAELIRRHGNPADGRHSVQIEINRGLYVDDDSLEPTQGYDALNEAITVMLADTANYLRSRLL
ncbi:MAG: N-formylglutamate amidohydrolase [Alphaproteobacteria bacterium]|nr:N-formylglutamate amidohydrolase [Alphaproteobacteria bacterium]